MVQDSALERLGAMTVPLSFGDTSNKAYTKLQSYRNTTSYSILSELHTCPRKYQQIKARASVGGSQPNNVDFAYGHAVGSGVQAWLSTEGDMTAAVFNAMMAWRLPYGASIDKKKKSLPDAVIAVQKYAEFHRETLSDWQVWTVPATGKPAIELSISVDFENGYKHYIHIDVILEHKMTGQLAVQENKTSGFKNIEEAVYANSTQALSYAVVVDMLAENTSYEVFYCVYSATDREWSLLPFTKHTSLKAEWITDVRLDHATLNTYHELKFYPKRGESCFNFMRRCEFFGSCNLTATLAVPAALPADQEAERVDFAFKLSDVIARQHAKNDTTIQPPEQQGVHLENLD